MLTIKTCTQKAKVLKFSLIIVQKRNGSKQYKGTAKRKYDPTFPLKHVFIEGDNAMFNKKYLPKNKRILQTKRPLSEFFKRKVKSKLALKKAVTEEENEELLDVAVTKQRGGTTYFDGGIDESNREFYERIEGMIPKAYYANQPKLNSSTSEWLFHGSPANLDDKPFDLYQKKTLFQNTDVHEELKLTKHHSTTNMHLFDPNGKIKKYSSPEEILTEFFHTRQSLYIKRKRHLIDTLQRELVVVSAKVKFIEEIISETIVVFKKPKKEIEAQLRDKNYPQVEGNWNYLVSLPIYTFSLEKITELKQKLESTQLELETIQAKSTSELWEDDLSTFVDSFESHQTLWKKDVL